MVGTVRKGCKVSPESRCNPNKIGSLSKQWRMQVRQKMAPKPSQRVVNMNVATQIASYGIPKTTVALVARVPASDVSRFLKGPTLVTANYAARITAAVKDIAAVIDAFEASRSALAASGVPFFKIDLRDVKALRQLIEINNKTQAEQAAEQTADAGAQTAAESLVAAIAG